VDPVLDSAARALAAFDPLAALRGVALRDDPPALALRGVAMAQLGEFTRARKLLARAAREFGAADPAARGRCLAAEAEVALACRDLVVAGRGLETAAKLLEKSGDLENASFARLQLVRRMVLLGDLAGAETALRALNLRGAPPRMKAIAALAEGDIAVRRFRAKDARRAVERAASAARLAQIPSLFAEVERAAVDLRAKVARLVVSGTERALVLTDIEALADSRELVVDACRREVRVGKTVIPLAKRPVLFALARALGEAAPSEASRETLVRQAFGGRTVNESLRARLRVEVGRLRRAISAAAHVRATKSGFAMVSRHGSRVLVLLPPEPGEASALLALLAGGESWSTSALAAALGASQRTVQRALGVLLTAGRVHALGAGRSRRWVAPPPAGFATTLLLAARDRRD
jgi:hypothetical protein